MGLSMSDFIAIAALIISIGSLTYSIFVSERDRARLKAHSSFVAQHPDYEQAHIFVRVANHGRRTAILRSMGGPMENGEWSAERLGEKGNGLPIPEHGFFEKRLYREDIYVSLPHVDSSYVAIWFEDSLGRKHPVKDSEENIKKVLDAYGDVAREI